MCKDAVCFCGQLKESCRELVRIEIVKNVEYFLQQKIHTFLFPFNDDICDLVKTVLCNYPQANFKSALRPLSSKKRILYTSHLIKRKTKLKQLNTVAKIIRNTVEQSCAVVFFNTNVNQFRYYLLDLYATNKKLPIINLTYL